MEILWLILPISLLLSLAFVFCYLWAVRSGQYSDTDTPAVRMLFDEDSEPQNQPPG